jgi:hypothetical protein
MENWTNKSIHVSRSVSFERLPSIDRPQRHVSQVDRRILEGRSYVGQCFAEKCLVVGDLLGDIDRGEVIAVDQDA